MIPPCAESVDLENKPDSAGNAVIACRPCADDEHPAHREHGGNHLPKPYGLARLHHRIHPQDIDFKL